MEREAAHQDVVGFGDNVRDVFAELAAQPAFPVGARDDLAPDGRRNKSG